MLSEAASERPPYLVLKGWVVRSAPRGCGTQTRVRGRDTLTRGIRKAEGELGVKVPRIAHAKVAKGGKVEEKLGSETVRMFEGAKTSR